MSHQLKLKRGNFKQLLIIYTKKPSLTNFKIGTTLRQYVVLAKGTGDKCRIFSYSVINHLDRQRISKQRSPFVNHALPTVLVIDDEKATLTMFRLFLRAYGYEVLVAENGKTGLDLVETQKPEIVFTDLKMPEMDGFEVLKAIKKKAPHTEVIVITGHGDMDLVVQALNLDATDFINKPIRRSSLDAALSRANKRLQMSFPEEGRVSCSVTRNIAVITVEGTLRRESKEQLQACCRQGRERAQHGIVFRFADNAALNGAGIAQLIQCLDSLKQEGMPSALVGLSENFEVICDMVGITRFAKIFKSESQAMEALKRSWHSPP